MLWILIFVNSLLSFIIGSLVGLSELLSRYSDPMKIFNKKMANLYILLNGGISILGFWAFKNLQGKTIINDIEIKNILISGIGAMVILRSSIASLNFNGKKVEIGLGAILQTFLDTVEKMFNRRRSEDTLIEMANIMENVDFELAKINLPSICLSTFQNFPPEQTKQLGEKISALSDSGTQVLRSVELGVILEQYFGQKFIESALKILQEQHLKYQNNTLNNLIEEFQ